MVIETDPFLKDRKLLQTWITNPPGGGLRRGRYSSKDRVRVGLGLGFSSCVIDLGKQ